MVRLLGNQTRNRVESWHCYHKGKRYLAHLQQLLLQAADELLGVADVKASFVIARTSGDEIALNCRSLGALNVQVIAESLGGGGHQSVAGAQFTDTTTEEVIARLKAVIDEQ